MIIPDIATNVLSHVVNNQFPSLLGKESSTEIYNWVFIITGIGAILAFIWSISKKIAKFIKNKYLYLEDSLEKIDTISKEFLPNHGSSLKDQINKIQWELARNTELTEKISTRQKWIFDNRETPIFESDNDGKCVWANPAYLNLIKRDLNSILGHGWKNFIAEEDRNRVIQNWDLCVKDGRDSEDTYTIVDSRGKKYKVSTVACKTGRFGYVGALKVLSEQ